MKKQSNIVVGMALLLAGCAQFGHQTSEKEPHGVLRFVQTTDRFGEQPVVKTFDGLPVSAGPEYRVKPGPHALVWRIIEHRQARYVTNSIAVEAGWLYDVDGDNVDKTRLQAP